MNNKINKTGYLFEMGFFMRHKACILKKPEAFFHQESPWFTYLSGAHSKIQLKAITLVLFKVI